MNYEELQNHDKSTTPIHADEVRRTYTSEQLQEVIVNAEQHDPALVERCKLELNIRQEAVSLKQQVMDFSDEKEAEVLRSPENFSPALVYCCQCDQARRKKEQEASRVQNHQEGETSKGTASGKKKSIIGSLAIICILLGVAFFFFKPGDKKNDISNYAEEESFGKNDYEKNKSFENYVVERFNFIRDGYDLLEVNSEQEKTSTDLLVEISDKTKIYRLAIECTWVEALSSTGIIWANETEMKHIMESAEAEKEANIDVKIFLIVGKGGNPMAPNSLYIVPIKYHADRTISAKYLTEFEIKPFNAKGSFHYDGEKLYLK